MIENDTLTRAERYRRLAKESRTLAAKFQQAGQHNTAASLRDDARRCERMAKELEHG